MSALLASVLIASLLGSLHCAGMCGGLVAFWAGADGSRGRGGVAAPLAYNGGRLFVYLALGAVAGGIGAAVDIAGAAAGLQRAAAILAGGLMVVWGSLTLLEVAGVRMTWLRAPAALHRMTSRVVGRLRGRPPVVRALAMGVVTAVLPCGWLYAFVITAAGAGSAAWGAAVMLAFWAGTVPVLVGLGAGIRTLAAPLRRHLPAITAVAIVAVGLLSITGRIGVDVRAADRPVVHDPAAAASHVHRLDPDGQPCCHER